MSAGSIGFIGILIILAFIIFIIYFIFKILQFVIVTVNLYKKMIRRQDAMLKILLDIRDNTQKYEGVISEETDNLSSNDESETFVCEECKVKVPSNAKFCTNCGVKFE